MVDSFVVYRSFHEALKELPVEQYGRIMYAINEYALNQVVPELEGMEKIVFTLVKPQLDANIKRQENGKYGKLGGRPRKTPLPPEQKPEPQPDVKEAEEPKAAEKKLEPGDLVLTSVIEAPKKPPLAEREPKNDMEKVEKLYLENYDALRQKGLMKTDKPIINWQQSRKLTKDALEKYGLDSILDAVRKSMDNDFCIQKGYSLTTILSSGVLAGLINGNDWHKGHAIDSVDHPADMGEVLF